MFGKDLQLVHSNILSIIDYCNAVYGGLTEKNIQKLQKIQNNAVRFIFNINGKKKKEHIMPYQPIFFSTSTTLFPCSHSSSLSHDPHAHKARVQHL